MGGEHQQLMVLPPCPTRPKANLGPARQAWAAAPSPRGLGTSAKGKAAGQALVWLKLQEKNKRFYMALGGATEASESEGEFSEL